jgi:hypothetical protein
VYLKEHVDQTKTRTELGTLYNKKTEASNPLRPKASSGRFQPTTMDEVGAKVLDQVLKGQKNSRVGQKGDRKEGLAQTVSCKSPPSRRRLPLGGDLQGEDIPTRMLSLASEHRKLVSHVDALLDARSSRQAAKRGDVAPVFPKPEYTCGFWPSSQRVDPIRAAPCHCGTVHKALKSPGWFTGQW